MNWNEDFPDVSQWQPRNSATAPLREALLVTCRVAQRRIVAGANAEATFNIDNFDAGLGVEDIVREEFARLLPNRYKVDPGVVNDRHGRTVGDCDLLIRDRNWSAAVKLGATPQSRRVHFPVESVYAAVEIKRTLGFSELDDAMKKLVSLARLDRPDNPYGHITENQHLEFCDRPNQILNPLHTTVFATRLADGVSFDDVVQRFAAINAMLARDEMLTTLCVLDAGAAWYSIESGDPMNADYMRDRTTPLVLQIDYDEPQDVFYRHHELLMGHLTRSVLGLVGIGHTYGRPPPRRKVMAFPDAVFNAST
jgi:hypothetical protein